MPSTDVTTTTTRLLPSQQEAVDFATDEALALYRSNPSAYYGGNQIASNEALQAFYTGGAGADIFGTAQGGFNYALGQGLDVANDPLVQAQADAVTNPFIKQFNEQILGNLRGDATLAGNTGTRASLAEGTAAGNLQQNVLDARANVFGQARGQALGFAGQALGQAGALTDLGQRGALDERAYQQSLLDVDAEQFWFNQNAPWQDLARYYGFATGVPQGGTSTTTDTTLPDPTPTTIVDDSGA